MTHEAVGEVESDQQEGEINGVHDSGAMLVLLAALSLVVSGGLAVAQSVTDPETGLGVTPPAGYTALAAPQRARYSAVIEVKRNDDRGTGCTVGFQPIAANRGLSQAQINELVAAPERRGAPLAFSLRSKHSSR